MTMSLFLVRCHDGANGSALRTVYRDAHLGHVRGSGVTRMAGPVLDEHERVVGSWLVIEAISLQEAEEWCSRDPFKQAGVYADVTVSPIRLTYTDLAGLGG